MEPQTTNPSLEVKPAQPGVCEICGHPVKEVHCKIRCFNCGFTRDCSDP